MPKLTIDGIEIEVEKGTSILQACEQLGIEIPRFCYHDKLSVPANCRMCLVDLEKAPKLVASCAMPCGDGMVVHTANDRVKNARKGVMEFLLINHPLDCPICDQGGECDLQDQAMAFGFDRSRFQENKRAVKDKELGPLVKTVMTRCIQCTRCVRFGDEIAGVPDLGLLNRGEDVEIGTYVQKLAGSELSGNMIDICPVGALTSKPYAFKARPWELIKTETIDVMDAVGSNIRVDARGDEVMRVVPRLNEEINEEWISDRTRFAYDGLKYQRLDKPYIRDKSGRLQPATWDQAFDVIAEKFAKLKGEEIGALVGDLADCESVFALRNLMENLGSPHMDCRQDGSEMDVYNRSAYLFNPGIENIEQADAILIVGANPRVEATIVNARIRKAWMKNDVPVGLIYESPIDLTYPTQYLGAGAETLKDILDGKHDFAKKILKGAKNPIIILGASVLARKDGLAIQNMAAKLAEKLNAVRPEWNGYAVLQTAAARVGALDLKFIPQRGGLATNAMLKAAEQGRIKALYLLGADDLDTDLRHVRSKSFIIYQGHHGDMAATHADVILPGAAYTEKNALYVNMEGRVQIAKKAVSAPGEAREDWRIIRALSERLGKALPFDNHVELRQKIIMFAPHFAEIDVRPTNLPWITAGQEGKVDSKAFRSSIKNYYMTNAIARASRIMAESTDAFLSNAADTKAVKKKVK